MSGEGGTSCEVELVSCSLSELSSCLCLHKPSPVLGSRRRKTFHPSDIPPEDVLLSAKRALLTHKPTLIDTLIHRNRAALVMGPKRAKAPTNVGVKRKREPEPSSSGPSKKLKVNAADPKKKTPGRKTGHKLDPLGIRSQLLKKKFIESGKNPYATRISSNKVKIPFSLRSGRKMADKGKKKKPLTGRKGSEGSDANGTKSDDELSKGLSTTGKKEPAKKLTPKKETTAPVSQASSSKVEPAKKSGNKSDAGGSTASEKTGEEVKKKRRKRKRWSLGMNPLKKPAKKKEPSERPDEVEDSDEDDESGRVSDTSMLSVATQDSSSLIQPQVAAFTKEEPEVPASTKYLSEPTKDEPLSVQSKVDVAVDTEWPISLSVKPVDEVLKLDCKIAETHKTEIEEAVVAAESTVCAQTSNIELAVIVVENGNKELDKLLLKDVASDQVPTECEAIQEGAGKPLTIIESPPETKADLMSVLSASAVVSDQKPELLTDNKPGHLVISKCESLANTPFEKTVLSGAGVSVENNVNLNNVEVGKESETKTEMPMQVHFKIETEDIDCVVPGDSAEDEAELKRDADSTTCDNPKGLDDSFGDLSLYVSEEDLAPGKEHDEGLPDSTNIPQADIPHPDAPGLGNGSLIKTEAVEQVENLTEEQKQMKESVLQALGLKSLCSVNAEAPEVPPPKRSDGYTGTLKAVIKLNRDKKQMVYKRSDDDLASSNKLEYRICSEMSSAEGKSGVESKKPVPEGVEVAEDGSPEPGKESNLIIPEKSSSFSIHPGRLCSDVCSYCFGKFGSLDTPCHVAQLKGEERQRKILENEPHLTGESCLCDACYRYVDRKANFPEKLKVSRLKPPAQASICCVTHCSEPATRTIKRKWLIKLKKSITNKLNIDMEKLGHGVYYPFCTQHHYWVEYFTVCGICRKRLNRNNLFSLGAEADRLNLMLAEDGIPARLSVNLFLCKLCRYYADLRLKYPDPTAIPNSNQNFYKNYRRKILMSLDIPVSDSDDELLQPQDDGEKASEKDSPKADEDVMSLTGLATLLGEQPQQQARIQVKFGNVNIGTLSNLNIGQQGGSAASAATTSTGNSSATAVIPGSNVNGASSHHKNEPTYPEVSLIANLEYQGPNTPDGSWERYQSTLQFDKKTKQLWTELQRPYGSQTSFLRHLVMLERVWRDGYLVLAADADEAASRYITSARNRIRAFETQGPKMQTSIPSSVPASSATVATPTTSASVSRPQPVAKKQPPISQPFPFLATGEIEVTPIRNVKPSPNVQHHPPVSKAQVPVQRSAPGIQRGNHQQFQGYNQQMIMNPSKKITPLDRAKSLVRMAPLYQQIQQHTTQPTGAERRGVAGAVRYNHTGAAHSSIPPLVRLPQTTPTQFFPQQMFSQQQLKHHINHQQSFFQNQPPIPHQQMQQKQFQHKQLLQQQHQQQQHQQQQLQQQHKQQIALPKLPKNLTVMSMPARPSPPQAITLSHAGITIEKQIAPTERRTSSLPIERPSISVFREPASP